MMMFTASGQGRENGGGGGGGGGVGRGEACHFNHTDYMHITGLPKQAHFSVFQPR